MPDDGCHVRAIFLRAVDEHRAEDWPAFLDAACEGDAALRERVAALLRAHDQTSSMPDDSGAALGETISATPLEGSGTIIGPYKLMRQIGEGGMGLVFIAEQRHPVRRKVALKLIKPGMDTREVVARFEAERQALALMDHPHIAQVFDAGTTDVGRPYFVMELVLGIPITAYCDREKLATGERLRLFVSVCRAVQHAHQKGVIHRDIKPSNVLVTLQDGEATVKIIDFGIAKAVHQQLTEKTIHTAFQQMLGTPLYMSPEQAGQSGHDIDTRTDIYSLGVLLYELLTGTTPFERARLSRSDLDEVRRILREEEPPKPSNRISTLSQAATVSARRRGDPKWLRRLFRRELDWIVMKSLEKDRERRYESAAAFAADVERHLRNEPVLACPPSAAYRFAKFARRNKRVLPAATALAATLLAAVGLLTMSNWRLRSEQEWAAAQFRRAETMKLAADENRAEAQNRLKLVLNALDAMFIKQAETFSTLPEKSAATPADTRRQQAERAFLLRGLQFYEQLAERPGTRPEARLEVGRALRSVGMIQHRLGHFEESRHAARQATQVFDKLAAEVGDDPKYQLERAESYECLYQPFSDLGQWPEAERSAQTAIALFEKLEADAPDEPRALRGLAACYGHLVVARQHPVRLDDLLRSFEHAEKCYQRLTKQSPMETEHREALSHLRHAVAFCLNKSGKLREAAATFGETAAAYQQLIADMAANKTTRHGLPTTAQDVAWYRHELGYARIWQGDILRLLGRFDEAETALRNGLKAHKLLVADNPQVQDHLSRLSWNWRALADLHKARGDRSAAERAYRDAIAVLEEAGVNDYQGASYEALTELYREDGRIAEAIDATRQAVEAWAKLVAANNSSRRWNLAGSYDRLGALLKQAGQPDLSQEAYVKGGEVWQKLVGEFPVWADYQLHFIWNRLAAGRLYKARGDRPAAEKTYRDAIALLKDAKVHTEEPTLYDALAELCGETGQVSDAIEARQSAIEAWKKLAVNNDAGARWHLAGNYEDLGTLLERLGDAAGAEATMVKAGDVWAKLVSEFPNAADNQLHFAWQRIRLAHLRKARGDRSAAEQGYRDAAAALEQAGLSDEALGAAYESLSDLYGEDGKASEAVAARRKAVRVSEKMAAETGNPVHRRYIADTSERLGATCKQANRVEESEAAYLKAIEVLEKLSGDFPDDADYQLRLARNRVRLGETCQARGNVAGAEKAYRWAVAALEQAKINDAQLCQAFDALAKLCEQDRRLEEAVEARQKSLAGWKKLAAQTKRPDDRWPVADVGDILANLLQRLGRLDEAEVAYRDAAEAWRKLAADYPQDAGDRSRLAANNQARGKLLSQRGRAAEALDLAREAVALREKLVADTNDLDQRRHLALARHDLAALLKQTDQSDESLAVYRAAAEVWEGLICENQDALDERFHLALNYRARSELLAPKDLRQAPLLAQQAVALWEVLLEKRVDYWDPWNLALDCQRTARLLALTDEIDDAEVAFRKAVAALDRMTGEGSFAIFIRAQRAGVQQAMSKLASRQGRADEADALRRQATAGFREAIAAYEELLLATPKHAPALNSLAWLLVSSEAAELRNPARAVDLARRAVEVKPDFLSAWNTLGVAHYRAGDWPAASEALMKSVSGKSAGTDGCDGFFLAMTHWQLGDQAASHKWYDQAVAWMDKNQPLNEELGRFRAETETLLGVRSRDSADLAGGKAP